MLTDTVRDRRTEDGRNDHGTFISVLLLLLLVLLSTLHVSRLHGLYTFTLLATTPGAGATISPILQIPAKVKFREVAATCTCSEGR